MKFVYVLTSSPNDIYGEQTYLSMYSLRRQMPNAHIELLVDDKTKESFIGSRRKIAEIASHVTSIKMDDNISNMRKSRILKTFLREYIEGDILFIDGDTIVNDKLDDIMTCECDIGMVMDAHKDLTVHYGLDKLRRQLQSIGFVMPKDETLYFNSGVMLIRDNKRTHDFFRRWNDNWKASSANGLNLDQPALFRTNIEEDHLITELGGEWNCQIMYGLNFYSKAKIIHYFASRYNQSNGGYLYYFMNPEVFKRIRESDSLPEDIKIRLDCPFELFSNQLEIIGFQDANIMNTHVYKLVERIYLNHRGLFNAIQDVLFKINKIKKGKKE